MNAGIIATRYAGALLRHVTETGGGRRVYGQVTALLRDPDKRPDSLEPELERFVSLMMRRGRADLLRESLVSFVRQYRRANHIKLARLTTAVPSPGLEDKVCKLIAAETGCEVILDSRVAPDIIGGFVFVVDDLLLDASVARQLELIRRQFIQKNKRIV